jgi:ABC-type transport system involved in multi-copper enzyme maturation permease subunit
MISSAIVRNTIRELVRARQAIPLAVVFVVLSTIFCRFAFGDDDLLTVTVFLSFFAIALNVILSAGIMGNDISGGQIQLLVTKPVRLSQIFFGKIAGVIVVIVPATIAMNVVAFFLRPGYETASAVVWIGLTASMVLSQLLVVSVSAALSVFVPGNGNAVGLVLAGAVFMVLDMIAKLHASRSILSVVLLVFFPHPLVLRELPIRIAHSEHAPWGYLLHTVVYASAALLAGLAGLRRREFDVH